MKKENYNDMSEWNDAHRCKDNSTTEHSTTGNSYILWSIEREKKENKNVAGNFTLINPLKMPFISVIKLHMLQMKPTKSSISRKDANNEIRFCLCVYAKLNRKSFPVNLNFLSINYYYHKLYCILSFVSMIWIFDLTCESIRTMLSKKILAFRKIKSNPKMDFQIIRYQLSHSVLLLSLLLNNAFRSQLNLIKRVNQIIKKKALRHWQAPNCMIVYFDFQKKKKKRKKKRSNENYSFLEKKRKETHFRQIALNQTGIGVNK